jgi:drug/metabolite transporter (DMT)-like permease
MEVSATGRRTELLSAAALVFVAFLFGTSFVIVKGALDDVDPVPFLALRGLFAALALAPFTIGRASKPGELRAATMTGLMYLAGMLSQTIGLQYTTRRHRPS